MGLTPLEVRPQTPKWEHFKSQRRPKVTGKPFIHLPQPQHVIALVTTLVLTPGLHLQSMRVQLEGLTE